MTDGDAQAGRRLHPRVWDNDFVLMRRLAAAYRLLIERHLGTARDLTVVDYGCGPMPYRPLFAASVKKYIGADLPGNEQADVLLGAKAALPLPDRCADVVVSAQVLEHALDVGAYLAECARVLRDQGTLLLSTHGTWLYHPHPTDVRRWTRWGLQFEIERCGFEVIDMIACMGPLAYTAQVRSLLLGGLLQKLGLFGRVLCGPINVLYQAVIWLQDHITPDWVTRDNAAVYLVAARRTG